MTITCLTEIITISPKTSTMPEWEDLHGGLFWAAFQLMLKQCPLLERTAREQDTEL